MSVYANIRDLKVVLQYSARDVTPYDHIPCQFLGQLQLDVIELLSGGIEALKAINNVETVIGPFSLQLSEQGPGGSPVVYKSTEGQPAQVAVPVIEFGERSHDRRRGLLIPFVVRVPRPMWPADVGKSSTYHLQANITLQFTHMTEGRIEHVQKQGSSLFRVTCVAAA